MKCEDLKTQNKLPIVYSKKYSVHFAGLEKLHPFDAAKGKHVQQVNTNLYSLFICSDYFSYFLSAFMH